MNEVRADQTLLGKRIKEEREYRGLSREEVGHCLDVPTVGDLTHRDWVSARKCRRTKPIVQALSNQEGEPN